MALQHATPMHTRSGHHHESDQIDDDLMHLLCAATGINRAVPLDKLLCPNVLLTPAESAGVEGVLRKILLQNSKTLIEINISGSTLPCQTFVLEHLEEQVESNGKGMHIEAFTADRRPLIRDDKESFIYIEPRSETRQHSMYYFEPRFHRKSESGANLLHQVFTRLDWFTCLRVVDVSRTRINSLQLIALFGAGLSTIEIVNAAECTAIGDRALYGIVAVLTGAKSALTHLLLAGCSGLTPSGIFYLSNLEPVTANRLQEIDVRGALQSVSPLESVESVSAALLNALQLASFQGLLRTDAHPDGVQAEGRMVLHKLHALEFSDSEPPMYDLQFKMLPLPAPGVPFDLCDRLIDDHMLSKCLPTLAIKWGQRLQHLNLEGTFITEKGLEHLKHCINLKSLSLSRCRNLLDKEKSNATLERQLHFMPHLEKLGIANTRISGRCLMRVTPQTLTELDASCTLMSEHGVRYLATKQTKLKHLNLSESHLINDAAMDSILMLHQLEYLNLSFCMGLSARSMHKLLDWNVSAAERAAGMELAIKKIDLRGVNGVDRIFAEMLSKRLSERIQQRHNSVEVLWHDDMIEAPLPATVPFAAPVGHHVTLASPSVHQLAFGGMSQRDRAVVYSTMRRTETLPSSIAQPQHQHQHEQHHPHYPQAAALIRNSSAPASFSVSHAIAAPQQGFLGVAVPANMPSTSAVYGHLSNSTQLASSTSMQQSVPFSTAATGSLPASSGSAAYAQLSLPHQPTNTSSVHHHHDPYAPMASMHQCAGSTASQQAPPPLMANQPTDCYSHMSTVHQHQHANVGFGQPLMSAVQPGSQPLHHVAPASSHQVYGQMSSQFTVASSTAAVPPSPAPQFNKSHALSFVASSGAQSQQHTSPAAARDPYSSMPLQSQTQLDAIAKAVPLAFSPHSLSTHHAEMAASHASQPSASSTWSSQPQHHMAPAVPHPVYGQMHAQFTAASSSAAMFPVPALLQSNASIAWGSGALSGAPQNAAGVPSPAAARDAYGHMPMQFQTQHVAGSAPLASSAQSFQHSPESPPPQLALQSATSNAWASATFHANAPLSLQNQSSTIPLIHCPPAPALQPAQSCAWGTAAFAAVPTMHPGAGAAAGQRQ